MRALVVYESMFGNTRTVAEAIADGLTGSIECPAIEVGEAPEALPPDIGLLVVGGPTHAFGLSRWNTRRQAAADAGDAIVSAGIGIREWLERLGGGGTEMMFATFDTRISRPRLPGSAARAAGRRLRRMGFVEAATAKTFWVLGTKGPLREGETARARRWGEQLGAVRVGTTGRMPRFR